MTEALELFKITRDEIISTNNITPEDIILVLDKENKQVYVYRGRYSLLLDEFRASALYERIINRFLNPNIYLLRSLIESEGDNDNLLKIKEYIVDHYPNLARYEFFRSLKNIFLFQTIRNGIKSFKNYEKSREWRSKLANVTNIWRLSIFNVISMCAIMVVLIVKLNFDINQNDFIFLESSGNFNISLWNLWLENLGFTLWICIGILAVIFLVNLTFILFPIRFPINPNAIQTLSKPKLFDSEIITRIKTPIKEKSTPKSPVLPPTPTKKSISVKKPTLSQIKIDLNQKLKPKLNEKGKPLADNKDDSYDDILNIPTPPMKKKMKPLIDKTEINLKDIDNLSKKDTEDIKYIIIDCPICKKNLSMPVPKKLVLEAEEPVVEISYLHGEKKHILAAQLDHDFDVRRRRASWVIFE